MSTLEAEIQVE